MSAHHLVITSTIASRHRSTTWLDHEQMQAVIEEVIQNIDSVSKRTPHCFKNCTRLSLIHDRVFHSCATVGSASQS